MLKKGGHAEGVEPINEIVIDNGEFLDILRNKIGGGETLEHIKDVIKGTTIYDKSGYSGNSVLMAKGDINIFIKIIWHQNPYVILKKMAIK